MIAAYVFAVLVGLLAVFQLLLALGLPLGRFAWGGQHDVLPTWYRVGSAVSILVYAFLGTVVIDHAGLDDLYPAGFSDVAIWVVVAFLVVAAIPNAISRSKPERFVMTPIAVALAILALVVALYAPEARTFSGMVLDHGTGRGPVFCTVVMESFPPQCGDPTPVADWSWEGLEHWDEQGQRWGDYTFDGVLESGVITPTSTPR